MLSTILKILGYGWLAPAVEAILTAKASPTEANIEAAGVAVTNGILSEYDPALLPLAEEIEATVPGLIAAAVTLKNTPTVANGEALATELLALIKVFAPNLPEADAAQLLSDIQKVLGDFGVK